MASSLIPSIKWVQIKSFAEPKKKQTTCSLGRKKHPSKKTSITTTALHRVRWSKVLGLPSSPTIGHERCHYPQFVVSYECCFVWYDIRVVEELGNVKLPLEQEKILLSFGYVIPLVNEETGTQHC